ncbi:MAG: Ig-like domain-containing protein [Clostridia bacterium]|nr:Ig-like domain-containing protein [Clostridia bacterium]
MKKIFIKSLSALLTVIMLFSAIPMLVFAADKADMPVFTVDTVEETPTKLTLKLSLTNGKFSCLDAEVTVNGLTCTSVYPSDAFDAFVISVKRAGGAASDCENKVNGKVSISSTESCTAPMDLIIYEFDKSAAKGVNGSDVNFTVTTCYISEDGKDVSVLDDTQAVVALSATHEHSNLVWTTTKNPTCGEEGSKQATCPACGEIAKTEPIAKTEHKNTHEEKLDATCTKDGYYKVICDDCGTVITNETYTAKGHGETRTERKEATCTQDGYRKVYCKDCGELLTDAVLPARHHDTTYTETKEATCTESGYVKTYCKLCKELLNETEVPATGHSEETITDTVAATCTKDGYIKVTCKVCGEVISETVLPKKGHGETKLEKKDKTCTENGYVRYICKDCGEVVSENILKSEGHKYVTYEIAATCTEAGHKITECSVCHDVSGNITIPAKGHKWTSWSTVKEPTYRSVGISRRTCANCGDYQDKEIPMIKYPVTGVKISMESLSMNFKKVSRLYADVLPEEAAFSTGVVWTSSNPKVVTVDENGTITAKGRGTAVITASTEDGQFSDSCTVTVTYSWLQWIIVYILFGWIWYI